MGWNPIRGITNAVRGIGRVVRGDFKSGLKDIAGVIPTALGALPVVGNVLSKIPGLDSIGGAVGNAVGKVGGLPVVGDIWDFVKRNPDLLMAGGSALLGALDAHKAGKLQSSALNRLGSATRPDLSYLTQDAGNPYAIKRRLPVVGGP